MQDESPKTPDPSSSASGDPPAKPDPGKAAPPAGEGRTIMSSMTVVKSFPAGPTVPLIDGGEDGYSVKCTQGVLRSMHYHARRGLPKTEGGGVDGDAIEVKGYLLGRIDAVDGRQTIFIEKSLALPQHDSDQGDQAVFNAIDKARLERELRRYPGGQLIGDYHSHPNHIVQLSEPDAVHMNGRYLEDYNVTAIVGPRDKAAPGGIAGFFLRQQTEQGRRFLPGQDPSHTVHFDTEGIPDGTKAPAAAGSVAPKKPWWKHPSTIALGVVLLAVAIAAAFVIPNLGNGERRIVPRDGAEIFKTALVPVEPSIADGRLVVDVTNVHDHPATVEVEVQVLRPDNSVGPFNETLPDSLGPSASTRFVFDLDRLGAPREFVRADVNVTLRGTEVERAEGDLDGEAVIFATRHPVTYNGRAAVTRQARGLTIEGPDRVSNGRYEIRFPFPDDADGRPLLYRVTGANGEEIRGWSRVTEELVDDLTVVATLPMNPGSSGTVEGLYVGDDAIFELSGTFQVRGVASTSAAPPPETPCQAAQRQQEQYGREFLAERGDVVTALGLCNLFRRIPLSYYWDIAELRGLDSIRYIQLNTNGSTVDPSVWESFRRMDVVLRSESLGRVAWFGGHLKGDKTRPFVSAVVVPEDQEQAGFEAVMARVERFMAVDDNISLPRVAVFYRSEGPDSDAAKNIGALANGTFRFSSWQ